MDLCECRRCGFIEGTSPPDARRVGRHPGLCRICACAEDLREWIDEGAKGVFVPRMNLDVVWLPEATQEFLSVMSRVVPSLRHARSTDSQTDDEKVIVARCCRGSGYWTQFLESRIVFAGTDIDGHFSEIAAVSSPAVARIAKGLRVVANAEFDDDHQSSVAGTLSGLTPANILATGAYRD